MPPKSAAAKMKSKAAAASKASATSGPVAGSTKSVLKTASKAVAAPMKRQKDVKAAPKVKSSPAAGEQDGNDLPAGKTKKGTTTGANKQENKQNASGINNKQTGKNIENKNPKQAKTSATAGASSKKPQMSQGESTIKAATTSASKSKPAPRVGEKKLQDHAGKVEEKLQGGEIISTKAATAGPGPKGAASSSSSTFQAVKPHQEITTMKSAAPPPATKPPVVLGRKPAPAPHVPISTAIVPIKTASRIQKLNQDTIHTICTNQVIISLDTCVKELVENSLDARARKIEITFLESGVDGLVIVDDGIGICEADLPNVCLRHCTSKLRNVEELYGTSSTSHQVGGNKLPAGTTTTTTSSISCTMTDTSEVPLADPPFSTSSPTPCQTFGFRGEALAACCALSEKFVVTTKFADCFLPMSNETSLVPIVERSTTAGGESARGDFSGALVSLSERNENDGATSNSGHLVLGRKILEPAPAAPRGMINAGKKANTKLESDVVGGSSATSALALFTAERNLNSAGTNSTNKFALQATYDRQGNLVKQEQVLQTSHGTKIEITNLFSITPVRRQEFVRNVKQQLQETMQLLQKFAACNYLTKFVIHNKKFNAKTKKFETKEMLRTSGCARSFKQACMAVYGEHLQNTVEVDLNVGSGGAGGGPAGGGGLVNSTMMLPPAQVVQHETTEQELVLAGTAAGGALLPPPLVHEQQATVFSPSNNNNFRITGLVSQSNGGKKSKNWQIFFVNYRLCDPFPKKILKTVNEEFKKYASGQVFPVAILNLECANHDVDVNITPDKKTIYLKHEALICREVVNWMKLHVPGSDVVGKKPTAGSWCAYPFGGTLNNRQNYKNAVLPLMNFAASSDEVDDGQGRVARPPAAEPLMDAVLEVDNEKKERNDADLLPEKIVQEDEAVPVLADGKIIHAPQMLNLAEVLAVQAEEQAEAPAALVSVSSPNPEMNKTSNNSVSAEPPGVQNKHENKAEVMFLSSTALTSHKGRLDCFDPRSAVKEEGNKEPGYFSVDVEQEEVPAEKMDQQRPQVVMDEEEIEDPRRPHEEQSPALKKRKVVLAEEASAVLLRGGDNDDLSDDEESVIMKEEPEEVLEAFAKVCTKEEEVVEVDADLRDHAAANGASSSSTAKPKQDEDPVAPTSTSAANSVRPGAAASSSVKLTDLSSLLGLGSSSSLGKTESAAVSSTTLVAKASTAGNVEHVNQQGSHPLRDDYDAQSVSSDDRAPSVIVKEEPEEILESFNTVPNRSRNPGVQETIDLITSEGLGGNYNKSSYQDTIVEIDMDDEDDDRKVEQEHQEQKAKTPAAVQLTDLTAILRAHSAAGVVAAGTTSSGFCSTSSGGGPGAPAKEDLLQEKAPDHPVDYTAGPGAGLSEGTSGVDGKVVLLDAEVDKDSPESDDCSDGSSSSSSDGSSCDEEEESEDEEDLLELLEDDEQDKADHDEKLRGVVEQRGASGNKSAAKEDEELDLDLDQFEENDKKLLGEGKSDVFDHDKQGAALDNQPAQPQPSRPKKIIRPQKLVVKKKMKMKNKGEDLYKTAKSGKKKKNEGRREGKSKKVKKEKNRGAPSGATSCDIQGNKKLLQKKKKKDPNLHASGVLLTDVISMLNSSSSSSSSDLNANFRVATPLRNLTPVRVDSGVKRRKSSADGDNVGAMIHPRKNAPTAPEGEDVESGAKNAGAKNVEPFDKFGAMMFSSLVPPPVRAGAVAGARTGSAGAVGVVQPSLSSSTTARALSTTVDESCVAAEVDFADLEKLFAEIMQAEGAELERPSCCVEVLAEDHLLVPGEINGPEGARPSPQHFMEGVVLGDQSDKLLSPTSEDAGVLGCSEQQELEKFKQGLLALPVFGSSATSSSLATNSLAIISNHDSSQQSFDSDQCGALTQVSSWAPGNNYNSTDNDMNGAGAGGSVTQLDSDVLFAGQDNAVVPGELEILSAEENNPHRLQNFDKSCFQHVRVHGQFNLGFILGSYKQELFIFDQHACDEKKRFEYLNRVNKIDSQQLLNPIQLSLPPAQEVIANEFAKTVFAKNGFDLRFEEENEIGKRCLLHAVPSCKGFVFNVADVEDLLAILEESGGTFDLDNDDPDKDLLCEEIMDDEDQEVENGPENKAKNIATISFQGTTAEVPRPKKVWTIMASKACRSAIMIGKKLSNREMEQIVGNLAILEQPWNCPHGRPTLRHLVNVEEAVVGYRDFCNDLAIR
ncbi:unnamed protein product [Amoebophrya sp. A120]|nr:unnamed protein product [Amoebophrya sp. A120]|eukprot:GSA120T00014436001.1